MNLEKPDPNSWIVKKDFCIDGKCTASQDQREACAGYKLTIVFGYKCMFYNVRDARCMK